MVVGVSQTAEPDTLNESWSCEEGGFLPPSDRTCRGFVWDRGTMRELPTLGGDQGFATAVNDRGQVVGWAETPVRDPTCTGSQVLQFRAVVWEPRHDSSRELPPFPGDSTSAATAINQRGQVVGISGDCDIAVGRFSARHAVLWDHGDVIEIPNLGGTTWHTPMDINERGDVVGFSNPAGPGDPEGEFIAQAFLWQRGSDRAVSLGMLEGDSVSEAFAINARGQVVGISFGGAVGGRAFLWERDSLYDLNRLADAAPDVLISAQDINDAGQITGRVLDAATGATFVFVATPVAPEPVR
jgi:probable HAF family extracellular repeat protein